MESTPTHDGADPKDGNLAQEIRLKLAAVAAKATPEDRKQLNALLTKAKSGAHEAGTFTITPVMAAILFLEHNAHNRDWVATYSQELARQMSLGLWAWNNATVGFYKDGILSDGQHRLAAAGLAGFTLETCIVFGTDRLGIVTVDAGKARYARDAAKLGGVENASMKESIVKAVAGYLAKSGDKNAELRSRPEQKQAIEANDITLDLAIEIGKASRRGMAKPIFKEREAATVAYLMLTAGWPEDRIREKLTYFQSGQAVDGDSDSSPCFIAAKIVADAHERTDRRVKLGALKELGIAMFAMVQSEIGVKAIRKAQILEAVKKGLPDPHFPIPLAQAA